MDVEPFVVGDPSTEIEGYDYEHSDQKYMVEVWIEKTTMADHLEALQEEFGFNLLQGTGFESITRNDELVDRAVRIGKPVRIFYISDLDSNGVKMPISVSRQIQWWIKKRKLDVDIKVKHLLLTRSQADEYDLPAAPITMKKQYTEAGRAIQQGKADAFTARYGEGTVELDALEGIHPGEFERIVREAIVSYFDASLESSLSAAKEEAETTLSDAMDEIMANHKEEIEACEDRINKASAPAKKKLSKIYDVMKKEIDATHDTLELPARPEADADGDDEEDWLFDSSRDEDDQMEHYRIASPFVKKDNKAGTA